jgi:hypothetical protein
MKTKHRIFALFLFTLTQCFAPLVHAHVDGIQGSSDASFHTPDIPSHFSGSASSECYVESYESQAISIPHEYQRDDALAILDNFTSSTRPSPSCIALGSLETSDLPCNTAYAYRKPHTQAPPQLS